jgi:hypothetical protein
MIQGAPPEVANSPQGYFYWLVSRGFPAPAALAEVTRQFGPPKTKQQQEQEAANQQTNASLATVGGAVAGTVATGWALNGFNIPDWLKSMWTTDPTKAGQITSALESAGQVSPGTSQAITQSFSSGGANLPGINPSFNYQTPQFGMQSQPLTLSGETTTINTSVGPREVPVEALNEPGFLQGINWSQVQQGLLGAGQVIQAYNAYKNKDYLGTGIYGLAGSGNIAASGLGGAAAQSAATSAAGGYLVPGLNLAAGGYGAYQTAQATADTAAGTQRDIGALAGGAGSGLALGVGAAGAGALLGAELGMWAGPIGMAVGALAGYAGSKFFGSKKGKAQFMRDGIRKVLREGNILNDKYQGTLADGSSFDFGQDGSHLKWKKIDEIAAANPNSWGSTVGLTNALAAAYGFVGQKNSDISAWYARAAVSNANDNPEIATANARHFAAQQGITYDMIKGKLDEAIADNRINQQQYDAYLNGAQQLTAGISPQQLAAAPKVMITRPKKGEVARVSPGVYRTDTGGLQRANTTREALQTAYNKTKTGNKD